MGTRYKDRLEGGYQLPRIRRFKAWTAAGLVAATSALVAFSLAAGGATAKPLYMPVDAFLPALLAMLLIGVILEMFFRSLSIRYAKKDSQRYLMVQNSINRSKWMIAACVVLAVVFLAPVTRNAVDSALAAPPTTHGLVGTAPWTLEFDNQDALGLAWVEGVVVRLTAGGPVDVRVTKETTLERTFRIPQGEVGRPFTIPIDTSRLYHYRITFSNSFGGSSTFTYAMESAALPDLFVLVPGIAVALAIASFGFVFYLRPQRERYERASIYSAEYREQVEAGERLYSEYAKPATVRAVAVGNSPAAGIPVPDRAPAGRPAPARVIVVGAGGTAEPAPPRPPTEAPVPSLADLFGDGAKLYSEGDYEAAVARFDAVLRREPRTTRALLAKGNALLRLGRGGEALKAYDEILSYDRGNLDALLGTAGAYSADRRWRDVIDLADTYLAMKPGDADMLVYRGDAQLALGHRSEAQISYEAALVKRPGDTALLAKIEMSKVDLAALQSRALIASASGNLDTAVALFDDVLKVEPENANALVGKSVALRRAGRVEEALACLDAVLARQPGHGGALLNNGRILEERGDLEDALEAYDKLIELNPKDPDAWVAQGDVLAKMGRDGDAAKSYREALGLAPADEDTKGKLTTLERARAEEGQLLRELFQIKGIGPAKARTLRDAGFRTAEDFRKATEDELLAVRGVTRKLASDIVKHFHAGPAPRTQP